MVYGGSGSKDYGVNTRFAGVVVFEGLRDANFAAPPPVDGPLTDAEIITFLDEYNGFNNK